MTHINNSSTAKPAEWISLGQLTRERDVVVLQLNEYGQALLKDRKAEQADPEIQLEEAAKVCDEIAVDRWNLYKGRKPYTGAEEGRAQSNVQGESDGAESCAGAIRALAQQEKA